MSSLVQVEPIALLPVADSCALFLGDGKKAILIYIDPAIGSIINMILAGEKIKRPLTPHLFHVTLQAMGARVTRSIIHARHEELYFARMLVEAENELQSKKIIELDARPSDCVVMAMQSRAPIYVTKELWDQHEDMHPLLDQMRG